jgi:hypothetical protein
MTQQSKTEAVFLRGAELLQQGATDQWLELFDDDAVLEFPFAPSGAPSRVEGKAAIAVVVVVVRDGLITLYRDYWNPLDLTV